MKELFRFLRRFVRPYRKNLTLSVIYNVLSAFLNVFSFALIIPILNILFKISEEVYSLMPMPKMEGFLGLANMEEMIDVCSNNFKFFLTNYIEQYGGANTLLILGLILIVMTLFKTGCYYASAAVMVPLRTGVVRDIRVKVYNKVLSLPMSFFSKERKGDIITRMSGDVTEVETSIASSLDMLIKNPIMIFIYLITMIILSWQLTIFTLDRKSVV